MLSTKASLALLLGVVSAQVPVVTQFPVTTQVRTNLALMKSNLQANDVSSDQLPSAGMYKGSICNRTIHRELQRTAHIPAARQPFTNYQPSLNLSSVEILSQASHPSVSTVSLRARGQMEELPDHMANTPLHRQIYSTSATSISSTQTPISTAITWASHRTHTHTRQHSEPEPRLSRNKPP